MHEFQKQRFISQRKFAELNSTNYSAEDLNWILTAPKMSQSFAVNLCKFTLNYILNENSCFITKPKYNCELRNNLTSLYIIPETTPMPQLSADSPSLISSRCSRECSPSRISGP